MKVTRLRNKSKFPQLVKKLKELHGKKVEVGFFSDSGEHTLANMSYASLAFIHAFPQGGYHHTRNWLEHTKPIKGDRGNKLILKKLLNSYIKLDSKIEVSDVLDHMGKVWAQKGREVFGNSAIFIVSNNPTPLVDTGELKRNLGYKTTLNYTLRYF
jgi:hypothetical protein